MTNEAIFKFRNNLKYEYYLHAYEMLIIAYEANPEDESIPELSKELLYLVQRKAMDLGSSKATEMARETVETDVLHRLTKLFISKL